MKGCDGDQVGQNGCCSPHLRNSSPRFQVQGGPWKVQLPQRHSVEHPERAGAPAVPLVEEAPTNRHVNKPQRRPHPDRQTIPGHLYLPVQQRRLKVFADELQNAFCHRLLVPDFRGAPQPYKKEEKEEASLFSAALEESYRHPAILEACDKEDQFEPGRIAVTVCLQKQFLRGGASMIR